MKVQAEGFTEYAKAFPGVRFHYDCRDLHIRLIGDNAAVTSFFWYQNRIIPGDLPLEKVQRLGQTPVPTTLTLVWEKQGNTWKIVNSHISPLYIPQ